MQIVTFYADQKAEQDRKGKTFILPAGEDLEQSAKDSGFYSYQVLRKRVDYLELTKVEQVDGNLFGVCWSELPNL